MKCKAIIAADFHVPTYDEKSLKEYLTYIKLNKHDKIIIAGDFLDLYAISKFDSAPSRADDLQWELTIAKEILQKIRDISDKEIIYIVGNHEERMEKFLSRGKNKALYNLGCLKIENLLDFQKYKITKINDIYNLNKNWIVTHGSKCGVSAAQGEALSYMKSGISGHTHRELTFKRKFLDELVEWHTLPCMADISQAHYAAKFRHAWNNGFAKVEYDNYNANVKIIRM